MLKLSALFLLFFVLAENFATSEALRCHNGTVGYNSTGHVVFYQDFNVIQCPQGQVCARATFNVDQPSDVRFETAFCSGRGYDSCSVLTSAFPDAINCTNSINCDEPMCNNFSGPTCSVGGQVYLPESSIVIFQNSTKYVPASINDECLICNFNNLNRTDNSTVFVQVGLTRSYLETTMGRNNCKSVVETLPNVGLISNCTNSSSLRFTDFLVPLPIYGGYRCDQGTFVYSENTLEVYRGINITTNPCSMNEGCGMFRYRNTDNESRTSYIEVGFCINAFHAANTSCSDLEVQPGFGNVSDCSFNFCSGSFCDQFKVLEQKPGCPHRPLPNEIQALPGCTASYALNAVAYCLKDYVRELPYGDDQQQCRTNVNLALSCMSAVVQECIQFDINDVICNSVLTGIPGVPPPQNLTAIFKMIESLAANVSSVESLEALLNTFSETLGFNFTQIANGFCANPDVGEMLLQALESLEGLNIDLGMPICNDNMILNDLIRWGTDYLRKIIYADDHRDVCIAFSRLKARLQDAVVNRCGGLQSLGLYLSTLIDPYYADLVQRGVNIVLGFLNNLNIPGCEDVPPHIVCNIGTVVYTPDRNQILFRENFTEMLCLENHICGKFNFLNTNENGTAFIENGFCFPEFKTPSCNDVSRDPRTGKVSQCTFEQCKDRHRCLRYTEAPEIDSNLLPDCSRFYYQQGSCARRQAWICDYISWKLEFQTVWTRQFREYAEQNSILLPVPLPGCLGLHPGGLCMDDKQTHCQQTADGCQLCFCRDLRYKDPTMIAGKYRQDWYNWRRAFQLYQQITKFSDNCNMD